MTPITEREEARFLNGVRALSPAAKLGLGKMMDRMARGEQYEDIVAAIFVLDMDLDLQTARREARRLVRPKPQRPRRASGKVIYLANFLT